MTTSGDATKPDPLSTEAVARLRRRIGVAFPHPNPPWYRAPNTDAFRQVSEACGDDNPLWCDPRYGDSTVWGGPIASPNLNGGDTLIGENEIGPLDAETKELLKGDPLRGAHAYYAGSHREWWAPVRPNMTIGRRNALVGVREKASEFADRSVHEWTGEVFAANDHLLSAQYRLMIRTDRQHVADKADEAADEKSDEAADQTAVDQATPGVVAPYTDAQLETIDAAYAAEPAHRRGAQPRYWEDVEVGDELSPLVKGPMRVTDIVVWHAGMGMGLYGVKALRLAHQQRQKVPGFFRPDDLNIPDVHQRVHWDAEWARRAGSPAIFDYGRMRETWLVHLCTDWMGDDAWLANLDVQFRKFNYVGDTHWMRGTIARKYQSAGGRPAVDLDIWGENQRGEITCPGHATVLLPSRGPDGEHRPVRLPEPPGGATTCSAALDALVERFAREP